MPISECGNSNSNISGNKIDTSPFVQEPYLRTNDIEANIDEDNDLKNQFTIKHLADPIRIREAASKNYVENLFNDLSIIKNTAHIHLIDRNSTNARFIQINEWPQIDSHSTAKLFVDTGLDEPSLVRKNKDNAFGNFNLTNINSITVNTEAINDNQVITKAYVDQFHQENERSRRDLGIGYYDKSGDLVKNNQDNDFNDNEVTNIISITVNGNPTSVSNKKYVDDSIQEDTLLRFSQTLQNYLKVSVRNDNFNLTKYDKIQIIDTKIIKSPNNGGYLLENWNIKCIDKNGNGKLQFLKKKTNSPTGTSGTTSLPPNGDSFIFIETSSGNSGSDSVFVSWERTDIFQFSNNTFYYNRFSLSTNDSPKSMGRFRVQLLLGDNTWSTQNTIPKNDQYSDTSKEWTLVSFNFTVGCYGF